jgi:hypothetical protein
MRNEPDRHLEVALLLAASALAGFALAFAVEKLRREVWARIARRRFTIVRGSWPRR